MLLAKLSVTAGGMLVPLIKKGVLRFGPIALLASMTAMIGGIVMFGSTKTPRDGILTTIRALEQRRAEMIDSLGLRPIEANGYRSFGGQSPAHARSRYARKHCPAFSLNWASASSLSIQLGAGWLSVEMASLLGRGLRVFVDGRKRSVRRMVGSRVAGTIYPAV